MPASASRHIDRFSPGDAEAFASALADWPLKGCPSNPEAWLLTDSASSDRHISRACREKSDELAVTAARNRVSRATRLRIASAGVHAIGS
jgi:predicted RNA polymerase sigma factor